MGSGLEFCQRLKPLSSNAHLNPSFSYLWLCCCLWWRQRMLLLSVMSLCYPFKAYWSVRVALLKSRTKIKMKISKKPWKRIFTDVLCPIWVQIFQFTDHLVTPALQDWLNSATLKGLATDWTREQSWFLSAYIWNYQLLSVFFEGNHIFTAGLSFKISLKYLDVCIEAKIVLKRQVRMGNVWFCCNSFSLGQKRNCV